MEGPLRQASSCSKQATCAACPKDMLETEVFFFQVLTVILLLNLKIFCNYLTLLLTTQIQGEVELVGFIRQGEKVCTS